MNLSLVTSQGFRWHAINLIESYRQNGPNKQIVFCYFDIEQKFLDKVAQLYGGQVVMREVEQVCPHACNHHFYFFKTFALKAAADLNEDFLYLDAAEAIVKNTAHLQGLLAERSRVFVQYPRIPFFRNARWTTKACLKKLDCEDAGSLEAHQYMGGFQAYRRTPENWSHIAEMYRLMQDPEIAGPENVRINPDGNGVCQAHRNEQSVLSLLINRNNWHQPFDPKHFMRYGDYPTLATYAPSIIPNPGAFEQIVAPRVSKLSFLTTAIRQRLEP